MIDLASMYLDSRGELRCYGEGRFSRFEAELLKDLIL